MSDENVMKIPADRATLNAVQKENQAELRLTDAKGRQIEGTFKKAETYRKGQNEVLDLAGIEEGARLDQRNEAYASVAASLGMKKIVPQARALAIRDPEGHEVEGTFIRKTEGAGIETADKKLAGLDEKAFEKASPEALKQIADLQALDYLCGGVGRTGAEMKYAFDEEGNLASVYGNPVQAAFGDSGIDQQAPGEMIPPTQMGIMRKATADKILKMTPDTLKDKLKGKIEEKAVTGAVKRLKVLQDQILESRKALLPDRKDIELPYIRELSDQDFENLDPKVLTETEAPNLFQKVEQTMPVIGYNASMGKPVIGAGMTEAGGRMSPGGVYEQIGKADELLKTLADHDPETAQGMKDAVMEYKDLEQGVLRRINRSVGQEVKGEKSTKTIYDQHVSIWDADKMNRSLHNIKDQASQFLTNKQEELHEQEPNAAEKKQMDDAKKLIQFADHGLSFSPDERRTMEKNEEKAALQNERLKAENAKGSKQAEGPEPGLKP